MGKGEIFQGISKAFHLTAANAVTHSDQPLFTHNSTITVLALHLKARERYSQTQNST